MDKVIKQTSLFIFVVVLIVAAGLGAGLGGYLYGQDKGEDEMRDELERKYEQDFDDAKAECKEDKKEQSDFFQSRIDKLESDNERLERLLDKAESSEGDVQGESETVEEEPKSE